MRAIPLLLFAVLLLSAAPLETRPFETTQTVQYLDDLLAYDDEQSLIDEFGTNNVTQSSYEETDGSYGAVSILYSGTNQQVYFYWWDSDARSGLYCLAAEQGTTWKTSYGLYAGMHLRDLVKLNKKPFAFYVSDDGNAGFISDWGGGEMMSHSVTVRFDQEALAKCTSPGDGKDVSSDSKKAKSTNPVITIVYLFSHLERPYDEDDYYDSDEYYDSSEDYGDEYYDEDSDYDDYGDYEGDYEGDFDYYAYFRENLLPEFPLLDMPFSHSDFEGYSELDPESNDQAFIGSFSTASAAGMLPDTTNYYGFLWSRFDGAASHLVITTLTKDLDFIDSHDIEVDHDAGDCGLAHNYNTVIEAMDDPGAYSILSADTVTVNCKADPSHNGVTVYFIRGVVYGDGSMDVSEQQSTVLK